MSRQSISNSASEAKGAVRILGNEADAARKSRIFLVAVLRHKMISCVRVRYEDSQIVSFSPNFAVGATMP